MTHRSRRAHVFCAVLAGFSIVAMAPAYAENDNGGQDAYGGLFAPPPGTTVQIPASASLPPPIPLQAPPSPDQNSAPSSSVNPDQAPATAPTTPPATWSDQAPGGPTPGPNVGSQLWGGGASTANGRLLPTGASDGYCDPEIAKLDEQLRAQTIQARTRLATSTYSTLPTGLLSLGCIDQLLNSTANIFGPGGLKGITNQIIAASSCERVLRTVNGYANQEIAQYSAQAVGYVTNAASNGVNSLGIGQAIPGVNLGALTAGAVNLAPSINLGGAGGTSGYVSLGQAWNNTGSYFSNGQGTRNSVTMPSRLLGQ